MDPNTPTPTPPQPTDDLIMPDLPPVTSEPAAVPVSTPPAPAPAPEPVPAPTPIAVSVSKPVKPASQPKPSGAMDTMSRPKPAPAPVPVAPQPVAVPVPVMPTPAPAVNASTMNQLDDDKQPASGQPVVAKSEPHKSRRKTMMMLVVGILLVGLVGFGAYTLFFKPNVTQTNTPAAILSVTDLSPEELKQSTDKAELTAGSQTNTTALILSGKAPTDAPTDLMLQVEVQPLGTDFTGTPTDDKIAVPSADDALKITLTDFAAGSYHWRARLSDGTNYGPWTAYNTADDAGKTADFTIDRTAPAAAVITTVNGRRVSGKTFTSTVDKPVFVGTGEAGSTVTVALSAELTNKVTVAADGTWTLTAPAVIPDARYTITLTATDPAGNATPNTYTMTQAAE